MQMPRIQPALLTRAETKWLFGKSKPSNGQERHMRHCINKKLQTFEKLELPLLISAGFASSTSVSASDNAVSARTNADSDKFSGLRRSCDRK